MRATLLKLDDKYKLAKKTLQKKIICHIDASSNRIMTPYRTAAWNAQKVPYIFVDF